jgi:hypothetical protein
LEDHIQVPCDAFVIGEPVSVIEFDYDGNVRRGLTARCRRQDGAEYTVDFGSPVELVALSIKDRAARCRLLRSHRIITLRASGF